VVRFQKTSNARFHEHELHKNCKLFRVKNSEWFESVEIPNLFESYFMDNDQQYSKILAEIYTELCSMKHLSDKQHDEITSTIKTLVCAYIQYDLIENTDDDC